MAAPATNYNFNSFQEIKSHSAVLYNERLAILFYMLDLHGIDMNTFPTVEIAMKFRGVLRQIYKNIRCLVRNNPVMRSTLKLDTKDRGIYVTDMAIGNIDKMVNYCNLYGYTEKRLYIIVEELNRMEIMIRDVLQYYHYFVRPDFRQKPDIDLATSKYKEMADEKTVEELREIVGRINNVDFDELGSKRISLNPNDDVEYDPIVDDEDMKEELDVSEEGIDIEKEVNEGNIHNSNKDNELDEDDPYT